MPKPDDGSIVMSWPWRLSLRVDDVLLGDYGDRRIEVIGLLHSEMRRDFGRSFLLGRYEGQWRLMAVSDKKLETPRQQAEAANEWDARICGAV
jgi:hypothetical protein